MKPRVLLVSVEAASKPGDLEGVTLAPALRAYTTEDEAPLVLLDTPGFTHHRRHRPVLTLESTRGTPPVTQS